MENAIRLITLYFKIGDIVTLEEVAGAYHELTWNDLYEENPRITDTLILTMFNDIKVKLGIEPIDGDKYRITSIG